MGLEALTDDIWLELKDTIISFWPAFTGNSSNLLVNVCLALTFLKKKQEGCSDVFYISCISFSNKPLLVTTFCVLSS